MFIPGDLSVFNSDLLVFRYDSIATKGRGERQELLFCDARGDDARHRQQRVPGVRHARSGHVRHEAGDHTQHTPPGPGGHPGRGAAGAQGAPHGRVRALRGVHRRARPLADEGPQGHQRRQPGEAGARERTPQAVLRPLFRHEHHQQRHRGDHTHPAANSQQLVQSSAVGARLLGLLNLFCIFLTHKNLYINLKKKEKVFCFFIQSCLRYYLLIVLHLVILMISFFLFDSFLLMELFMTTLKVKQKAYTYIFFNLFSQHKF